MPNHCDQVSDEIFGPQIQGCHYLDFTLLFEQTVLSIIPSGCFLLVAIWRLERLVRQSTKVTLQPNKQAKRSALAKIVLNIALIGTQLAVLILWAIAPQHRNRATISSVSLSLACSVCIFALSCVEHRKSVSPSHLICFYLFCNILFDIVQARTLWLRDTFPSIAGTFTATLAIRFVLLIAELQEKQKYLVPPFSTYPPEALGGMVNRLAFWWLNRLLARGARGLLNPANLFPIDPSLRAEELQERFSAKWHLGMLSSIFSMPTLLIIHYGFQLLTCHILYSIETLHATSPCPCDGGTFQRSADTAMGSYSSLLSNRIQDCPAVVAVSCDRLPHFH